MNYYILTCVPVDLPTGRGDPKSKLIVNNHVKNTAEDLAEAIETVSMTRQQVAIDMVGIGFHGNYLQVIEFTGYLRHQWAQIASENDYTEAWEWLTNGVFIGYTKLSPAPFVLQKIGEEEVVA